VNAAGAKDTAPEGFYTSEYQLDVDHWSEGFVTA